MYLFMDVLINQPRNAGSSTSLTASIALGIKFFLPTLNLKSSCFLFPVSWMSRQVSYSGNGQ